MKFWRSKREKELESKVNSLCSEVYDLRLQTKAQRDLLKENDLELTKLHAFTLQLKDLIVSLRTQLIALSKEKVKEKLT